MLFAVFMLLGSSVLAPWVAPARAASCAVTVAAGAVQHGAPLEDALLVATWAARESGCDPRRVSADGLDCGLLQQRGWARRGASCEQLMDDPELAVTTWLEDLDELRLTCGSTSRALGALATGKCGGAPALVRRRLAQAVALR